MLVQTIKGLIPREELEIKDIITEGENDRTIASEWYHKGELVKRDVAVSILRGLDLIEEQGNL